MKKRMISLILGITMLSTLFVGCGNQKTSSEGKEGSVPIEYWHTMSGINGEVMGEIVSDFNDTIGKEKGIVVKCVYQGDDVSEKLKTLAQANDTKNLPNVAQIVGAGIPSALNYEQLIKIEDMYKKGKEIQVKKESLDPHAVRAFSYKDELIAMPFNVSSILLYYNKDMFEKAGIEKAPETIDEMAKYCEKLMVKNGDKVERYGLNVAVRRYQLANWIGGQGEFNFFGDNEGGRTGVMSKVTFGEDGTLDKYLTEWEKVVQTGGYKAIEDNINEEFALELFGMAIMSSARIGKINELVGDKFEWSTANLPKVDEADQGGTSIGGSCLLMFDKGNQDQVDASWLFSQYLASPQVQIKFDTTTGYLPVNTEVYEEETMKNYLSENPNYLVAIEQMKNSNINVQEPFDIINWEIDEIIKNNMEEFGAGKQDKKTTAENIVNQCNEKLGAYVKANES